jgi:endonuclease-3
VRIAEKKEWAAEVVRRLRVEYPDAECALIHRNPYELVVSTVLSAQCTDEMVNKVTPPLFERYPTPGQLGRARQKTVEKLIHSTGFYRNKAKNIRGLGKRLSLPGVARKTANVVLGVAYRIAEGVVVDTHVKRITKLLGLTRNTDPVKVERDLVKLLPQEDWIDISHLLIWHGRKVCIARRPRCEACVLADRCVSA